MKARVKGFDDPFKEIETVTMKGVNGVYFVDDVEFEQRQEPTSDHWQDVRERAAMQGLLAQSGDAYTEKVIAREAVIYADALVEKLKGE